MTVLFGLFYGIATTTLMAGLGVLSAAAFFVSLSLIADAILYLGRVLVWVLPRRVP